MMIMTKKPILLFVIALIALVMVGCNLTTTSTSTSFTTQSTSSTTEDTNVTTETPTTTTTTTTSGVISTAVTSNSPTALEDTRPAAVVSGGKLIIDNSNREFSYRNARYVEEGNDLSVYNNSYVDNYESNRFSGSFKPVITVSGYYKIYMNFPELENPSDEVVLQIDYEGGLNSDFTKTIDQTINAGYWVMIGTYYLTEGSGNAVHIFGLNGYDVAADAVLFDFSVAPPVAPTETPLELRNPVAPTNKVIILQTRDFKFRLSLDGEEFFVKGVCGVDEMGLMNEAGSNAARTYSVDALKNGALLDEAYAKGIKIIVGLWMDHETASFTYHNNPSHVQEQYEEIIASVDKYKNHPAILGWAVGNEVDISTSANPLAIYAAMNAIAKYIHEADPYHPTMAVLAGSSTTKISSVSKYAPHIDIIGINTYKSIANAANSIAIWNGPYMLTEYALNQPSETTLKTSWGAIIEPSNIDKANLYYQRYQDYILGERDQGLIGSFVFKDTGSFRVTHTWYGIVFKSLRTSQFYAMMAAWTETERLDSMYIETVTLGGKSVLENVYVAKGSSQTIQVSVHQITATPLVYTFEIKKETSISSNTVPAVETSFVYTTTGDANIVNVLIPQLSGAYRLFVYVSNADGDISSYNFPFYISAD